MSDSSQFHDEHERQLDAIIARYYRAVEEGLPPDQDKFAAQHPEFEKDLCEFFADLGHLQGAVPHAEENPALSDTVTMKAPQLAATRRPSVVRYFGEYEILGELGVGGMGVVYKARQTKLRRIVALKMIKAGELANPQDVQRFQAEAKAVAKLSHPGIVAVHEVGMHQGQYFYTMDFVGGGNLSKLHHDGPVSARRAAELVRQLAEAVHHAHGEGIVHRDLKPANVLLTEDGAPRITDFGLAKRMWVGEDSLEAPLTETGQILGTAGYMSPEQAAGKTRLVGPPADIYALGSILYALLTSRAPFVGESLADTILQLIHKEPVSPHALNPSVARDLETICLKCLAKEPHKRYGTAQLLAEDLARFLDGRPVVARPISRPARTWRWCRRNPWIAGLSAAVAASLLIGTIVSSSLAVIAYQNQIESDQRGRALSESLAKSQKLSEERTAALNDSRKKYGEIVQLTDERTTALDEARWQVYRLRLMRMEQLWREKDWGHLERLLAESVPAAGEKDLRGWEWHYLQGQLERRAWRMYESPEKVMALDWDRHTDKLAVFRAGAVDIWLPRERRLLKSIEVSGAPHSNGLVRWSPDQRHLAIDGGFPKVQVVVTETGQIVCTLVDSDPPPKGSWISYVDWSPRGDCVAITFAGNSIRLWKVAQEPVLIKLLEAHEGVAQARIHWSPDQATCVTTSNDGWAMYWRTADWTLLHKKQLFVNLWCSDMAWSPDGTRMAFGSNIVVVADADGTQTKQLADQGASITALCWLDNNRLVTANEAQEIHIVHIDQQVPDDIFRLHSRRISGLSIGLDGQIASVAPGESVKVWPPSEISVEHITLPGARLPSHAAACIWHPQLNVLSLVSEQQGINVTATWSPGAHQVESVPFTVGASSVYWSPLGDALVIETTDSSWKTLPWPPSMNEAPTVTNDRMSPSYSSDGRFRLENTQIYGQIAIVDTHEKVATTHPKIENVYAKIWHPRKPCFAVATQNLIRLCDLDRQPSTWAATPFTDQIHVTRSLAWGQDGKYLLAGSSSGVIHVMDGATLEIMHALRGHAGSITVVAWSNDGTRIVSAGLDGFLRWWDAAKGVELFKIPIANSDSIYELHFSADGRWLAGRSEAGKVYVWTTESPQVPTYLEGPIEPITADIERHPNNADAFLRRGRWFAVRQKWREARPDFESAHALDPNDRFTLANVTTICLMLEDYPAYDRYCATIEAHLTRAKQHASFEMVRALMLGHTDLALRPQGWKDKLDALLTKDADNPLAARYRAMTLYRIGKWAECIAAAEQQMPAGPRHLWDALPWLYRTMALQQLGEVDQAKRGLEDVKRFVEATEVDSYSTLKWPRDVCLMWFAEDGMYISVTYREASQLILNKSDDLKIAKLSIDEVIEETVESLTVQINADPNNAQLWLLRGRLHQRWHRWDQAADDYQQCVRLTPTAHWERHELAITSLAAGREKDYFQQCREIEVVVNSLATPLIYHTLAARTLSLRPGGFTDGDKLLASSANFAEKSAEWWIVHRHVPLLYRLERYDEALREARRIEPTSLIGEVRAPLHAWEAMILWRLGRHQESREALILAKRYIEDTRRSRGQNNGELAIEAMIALREAEALVTAEN